MMKSLINRVHGTLPVIIVEDFVSTVFERVDEYFERKNMTEEELEWENMTFEERLSIIKERCNMS